ncbi:cell division protein SepF [Pseudonocardia acaciae]|uniref:cell division protein SepF n=1 Tax=Pseudonocardia acaciae TaxID=551276 RepID=UPI00048E99DF|nr:cell division protein SepF [Pseudonocardia acaciae]
MSTLYRLKAYFGMVPAEDMDAYLDYDDDHRYYDDRRSGYSEPGSERPERRVERHPADAPYEAPYTARQSPERRYPERSYARPPAEPVTPPSSGVGRASLVHGSLAVDPPLAEPPRKPVAQVAPEQPVEPAAARPLPLSRITTVQPRSYDEARTIGERYREGIPVIMNLTELDDAAAKRLVDFAAGLVFALRGSFDKVTSRVFLISPPGVEVSAEDRRRLAERGFFGQA